MSACASRSNPPNLVMVFGDQWRAQAFGYAGDPNVKTPHIDRFAGTSVNVAGAVSGCPVCAPARASLLTGQLPLTHGVFVNDVPLNPSGTTFGHALADAGYRTGYIGKWHVNGHGRRHPIPRHRRHGFEYWRVLECTHDYMHSAYFADDATDPSLWKGYDAIAQTKDACDFILNASGDERPFALFLSWGPPHDPYEDAPVEYLNLYAGKRLEFRANVPEALRREVSSTLEGYYAHCTALDDCFGSLLQTLHNAGLDENTLVVFFSDHGDMLGSQGAFGKQSPYEESIRVPLLLRWPGKLAPHRTEQLMDIPDLMPTTLGLLDIPVPESVEGQNHAPVLRGVTPPDEYPVVLTMARCFHAWKAPIGGREYRGIRTSRHTYACSHEGPWLLFDNEADPWQMENLCARDMPSPLLKDLNDMLFTHLERRGDCFEKGEALLRKWGYRLDPETLDIPIPE